MLALQFLRRLYLNCHCCIANDDVHFVAVVQRLPVAEGFALVS